MDRYEGEERESARRRMETLAWLMDSAIPIPGLQFRIGLDGVLGLLPGFGDAVGAIVSSYILAEAARLGAPKAVLLKMAFNVALDAVLGAIPFLGDLFDFTWKANRRNLRLLENFLERPRKTAAASRLFVTVLAVLLVGFVVGMVFLGALVVGWLWKEVTG